MRPDVIDDPDAQWLELLRPFNTMKHLHLYRAAVSRVAQALGRHPLERVMEVLPALENFGPVKDAMSEFADARQVSGRPVSIYIYRTGRGRWVRLTLGKSRNGSR